MSALDLACDLRADGTLTPSAARQIAAHLRAMARPLGGEGTLTVRVQIGPKLRSGAQNRLYWSLLARIATAYTEAGRPMLSEALHLWYKALHLPAVASEVERETGEMLGVERWVEMPDGSRRRTLTTTALTVPAFRLYIERIAWDDDVVAMGVDLSDLLAEAGQVRSGRLDETTEQAGVDYGELVPMADEGDGLSDAGRIQAQLADLF